MKTYSSSIIETQKSECGARIQIAPVPPAHALPGQYYLAFAEGTSQILPVPLFPFSTIKDGVVLCGKIQSAWQPGITLLLQGPYGKGFSHCLKSSRLGIFTVEKILEERLYSLAIAALNQGADVAWISDEITIDLPPLIEVLKESELEDAIAWSEGCAIAVPQVQVSRLPGILPLKPADRHKMEVMIDAPFVCGNSQCGVCAVETRHGWKLACKDGPIFPYGEFFNE
jgi:NAD(P)H-flavin reductase